jgi:hypothetical protein
MQAFVIAPMLGVFGIVSFLQNAAFTWCSRSRNSGDPDYHRKVSWASNGVCYITNVLLTIYIIKFGGLLMLALQGLVYTVSSAEGSVLMMKRLIAEEKGKQKVGNQFNEQEAIELRELLRQYTAAGAFTGNGSHSSHYTAGEQKAVNAESYAAPQGKDSTGN